jgi:hypothetical protein
LVPFISGLAGYVVPAGKWISTAWWTGQNLHVHVRLAAVRLAAP